MRINPDIVMREEFDHWGVVFNPDNGEVFALNPTSVLIWLGLAEGLDKTAILTRMRERCESVPDTAAADLDEFIAALVDKGYCSLD